MRETDSGKSRLLRFVQGSFILVLSNVFLKAVNFFLLPLYTNNLTPSMLGVSDTITTLTGLILPLLVMGLDSAYSAFYFEKSDADRAEKVFSTLTWTLLAVGFVPLLLTALSPQISVLLFRTPDYGYIVRLAMVSITFSLWQMPYSMELRLRNRMFLLGLSNAAVSLSMLILNILFVTWLRLGEASLILSSAIVHMEQYFVVRFLVRTRPDRQWFDGNLLRQMLKFSAPLIPMTLMMWVLSLSDRYVLLYWHGEAAVGQYGIGLRFTNLMNVIISAVSTAYTTFAFSGREDRDSQKHYYYVFSAESFLLLCAAFTAGLFGKEIIRLMTSEAYSASCLTVRDLMFSQVFYAMATIVGYGIHFEKKSIYTTAAVSVGALCNLGLNFLLIPEYGISAAALTTLLGYALHYALTFYFSEKLFPCDYGQRRALVSLAVLYAAALLGAESGLWVRILLWIFCVAGLTAAYRDLAGLLWNAVGALWARRRRAERN